MVCSREAKHTAEKMAALRENESDTLWGGQNKTIHILMIDHTLIQIYDVLFYMYIWWNISIVDNMIKEVSSFQR